MGLDILTSQTVKVIKFRASGIEN